jgi:hypothetical protein
LLTSARHYRRFSGRSVHSVAVRQVVLATGVEPVTFGLQNHCSTN